MGRNYDDHDNNLKEATDGTNYNHHGTYCALDSRCYSWRIAERIGTYHLMCERCWEKRLICMLMLEAKIVSQDLEGNIIKSTRHKLDYKIGKSGHKSQCYLSWKKRTELINVYSRHLNFSYHSWPISSRILCLNVQYNVKASVGTISNCFTNDKAFQGFFCAINSWLASLSMLRRALHVIGS